MDKQYRDQIAKEFRDCVKNTLRRTSIKETYRPFHTALLSDEALFWSRFERSFSTSFGQRVIEEVSSLVAIAGGASDARRQEATTIRIDAAYNDAIDAHIHNLREGERLNWDNTLATITSVAPRGKFIEQRVISDLWWRKDGIDYYMSIKTVKPNIDQTAVAKQDLLRLALHDPVCKVFFGLYYNPYGEDKSCYAHTPPMGVFDFRHDRVVLIGREYWDTLGGAGTYHDVLTIAREVGEDTRRILDGVYKANTDYDYTNIEILLD